jgi:hypothetical protein
MRALHASIDNVYDEADITLGSKGGHALQLPLLVLPPVGTCATYTDSFQDEEALPASIPAALTVLLEGRGLRAGPTLKLEREGVEKTVNQENGITGYYRQRLGQQGPAASRRAPPLFLEPGNLILSGTGGADIGPFRVVVPAPTPFEWIGRENLREVARQSPLLLQWRLNSPDHLVLILATNTDQFSTASGSCLCVADAKAGHFEIPPAMLANVPVSQDLPGVPFSKLFLSAIHSSTPQMNAKGLDRSAVVSMYTVGRWVEFH